MSDVGANNVPLLYQAHKLDPNDPRYLFIEEGDVVELVLENGWALNRVNEQRK